MLIMNRFFILKTTVLFSLISLFFTSCHFDVLPDTKVAIPDKYNTGCNEKTQFKELEIYTEKVGNQTKTYYLAHGKEGTLYLMLNIDEENPDKSNYIITSYSPNEKNLPKYLTLEDYDFSNYNIVVYGVDRYSENKYITFKNCKFRGFANCGPYDNNKNFFTFEHCTFNFKVFEVNITMNWCKIGGFASDAMNPLLNFNVNNTYVYNLACAPDYNEPAKRTHLDGTQIYGRKGAAGGNIHYNNVRFEIPGIYYDGNTPAVNACLAFALEYGDVQYCSFNNLICNGGGKWYPIYLTKGSEEFNQKSIAVTNVKVSNNYDIIFYPASYDDKAFVNNVTHTTELYVTSIFQDENTHIICTNDTFYDKILTVKTDKGDFTFDMPHCPSDFALQGDTVHSNRANPDEPYSDSTGKPYTSYVFEDLPIDVDCTINGKVNVLSCYDGEIKIY